MKKIVFAEKNMIIEDKYKPYVLQVDTIKNLYTEPSYTDRGELVYTLKEKDFFKELIEKLTISVENRATIILQGDLIADGIYHKVKSALVGYRVYQYSADTVEKFNAKFTKVDSLDYVFKTFWTNVDEYKAINHIGDIHGCYTVLMEYLNNGELPEDELFIFTGDYLERGIENMEVLRFLLSIYKLPNVRLLEGNHERYYKEYAKKGYSSSKYFNDTLINELNNSGISKKSILKLYKSLVTFFAYERGNKRVFVSHGGLFTIPEYAGLLPDSAFIQGSGTRSSNVDTLFNKNKPLLDESEFTYYQIHGHRNSYNVDIQQRYSFNLEGEVEHGQFLRTLRLDSEFTPKEVKNTVYDTTLLSNRITKYTTVKELVQKLGENPMINSTPTEGDIKSFHFNRNVFYNGLWNSQSVTARGIHIDTLYNKIIARGFDKFFNSTEESMLFEKLNYPAVAYEKLNGYLGMASIYNGEFYLTSKSDSKAEHSIIFSDFFHEKFNAEQKKIMKEFIIENDVTLVFEVIMPELDPHIISYDSNDVILLNIVKNKVIFETLDWEEVTSLAKKVGITHAKVIQVINSEEEFKEFVLKSNNENVFDMQANHIEGSVISCPDGYMTKIKNPFYLYWKFIRSQLEYGFKAKNKGDLDSFFLRLEPKADYEATTIINYALTVYSEENKEPFNIINFVKDKDFNELILKSFEPSNKIFFEFDEKHLKI